MFVMNTQVDLRQIDSTLFHMAFQKQCPSCTKYVTITTVEGKYETAHRCPHCGFVIRIPPKQYAMKSGDYGD